jgi:hypothetical protein
MVGNEEVMGFSVMVVPHGKNQVVARRAEMPEYGHKRRFAAAFERGSLIGQALPDTLEWTTGKRKSEVPPILYEFVSDRSPPWQGPWPSEPPQYLGLKLMKEGKTYYGWAQLRLDQTYQWAVSIHEKAYNPRPGQPIRVGHTP